MSWLIKTFSSSIGQKILMALTGLFLCTFIVVHLIGNLQLFLDDQGFKFNAYTKFMTSNPLIKIASYMTYLGILFHALKGLTLVFKNRSARGKGYKKYAGTQTSTWSSRSMGLLGTIILAFIVVHMAQFWYQYKFGESAKNMTYFVYKTEGGKEKVVTQSFLETMSTELNEAAQKYQATNDVEGFENDPVSKKYEDIRKDLDYAQKNGGIDQESYKDLYSVVDKAFHEPWIVLLYVVSMIAIGFHLFHGFISAFQTMGWRHPKYDGLLNGLTWIFGVIIPAGFALIPLYMYFS
ncbi:MAG: succinate dehydrogenase [Bacteroidetes bacterium]|nr:succinate dehydrogenase [Bacteroidota bacterium]